MDSATRQALTAIFDSALFAAPPKVSPMQIVRAKTPRPKGGVHSDIQFAVASGESDNGKVRVFFLGEDDPKGDWIAQSDILPASADDQDDILQYSKRKLALIRQKIEKE